jgi:hypothetical protein
MHARATFNQLDKPLLVAPGFGRVDFNVGFNYHHPFDARRAPLNRNPPVSHVRHMVQQYFKKPSLFADTIVTALT